MKKIFSVLMVGLLAIALLSGCRGTMKEAADDVKDGVHQAADEAKDTVNDVKNTVEDTADKSKFIGEEEAKKKALERAGISADGVVFDRVELDRDDGVWLYEVDFRKDGNEYDVDVKADTGEVLNFETEKEG